MDKISREQDSDSELRLIKNWLTTGIVPDTLETDVQEGILYHYWTPKYQGKPLKPRIQILVP